MQAFDRHEPEQRIARGKRPERIHVSMHHRVETDVREGRGKPAHERYRPGHGVMPDPQQPAPRPHSSVVALRPSCARRLSHWLGR
jgi:hypothetical protein